MLHWIPLFFVEYYGPNITKDIEQFYEFLRGTTAEDEPLTDLMMTLWTNFAKSG